MSDIIITEVMDERAIIEHLAEFQVHYDGSLFEKPDELRARIEGARAIIVRNRTELRGDLLAAAKKLEVVGRLGVGLDNIDMAACLARNISVYPATGANEASVAEYVIATSMIMLRGAYFATPTVINGDWPRNRLMGNEIAGKVLGLVGFGAIARETAWRAKALGMIIIAYHPRMRHENYSKSDFEKNIKFTDLDSLLCESDIVSLHVPLTQETRLLISADLLNKMRPESILINTSRGGVVDEGALIDLLRRGRIRGAVLDVFENEPLIENVGRRFAGCPNLILTPHIAGATVESNVRVSNATARAIYQHLTRC